METPGNLSLGTADVSLSPGLTDVLKDVVAYVEVRTASDNRSAAIQKVLERLGARVERKFTDDVTHVIFKEGTKRTYDRAVKRRVHLVSVLWVDSCREQQQHVPEESFAANTEKCVTPPPGLRWKKCKSMQPRDFNDEMALSAERLEKRRKRLASRFLVNDTETPNQSSALILVEDTQPRSPSPGSITIPITPPSMQARILQLQKDKEAKKNGSYQSPVSHQSDSETALHRKLFTENEASASEDELIAQKSSSGIQKMNQINSVEKSLDGDGKDVNADSIFLGHKQPGSALKSNATDSPAQDSKTLPKRRSILTSSSALRQVALDDKDEDKTKTCLRTEPRDLKGLKENGVMASDEGCGRETQVDLLHEPELDSKSKLKRRSVRLSKNFLNWSVTCQPVEVESNIQGKKEQDMEPGALSAAERRQTKDSVAAERRRPRRRLSTSLLRTGASTEVDASSLGRSSPGKPLVPDGPVFPGKGDSTSREGVILDNEETAQVSCDTDSLGSTKISIESVTAGRKRKLHNLIQEMEVSDQMSEFSHKCKSPGSKVDDNITNPSSIDDIFSEDCRPSKKGRKSLGRVKGNGGSARLRSKKKSQTSNLEGDEKPTSDGVFPDAPQPIRKGRRSLCVMKENREKAKGCSNKMSSSDSENEGNPAGTGGWQSNRRVRGSKSQSLGSRRISDSVLGSLPTNSLLGASMSMAVDNSLISTSLVKQPSEAKSRSSIWEFQTSTKCRQSRRLKLQASLSSVSESDSTSGEERKQSQLYSSQWGKKPSIVMTSLHRQEQELVITAVKRLGGFVLENNVSCHTTHLVCGEPRRTLNVLHGMARGCWLLNKAWVMRSLEAEKWIPEEEFELSKEFPKAKVARLARQNTPDGDHRSNLFSGVGVVFVSSACTPRRTQMVSLLRLCGAKVTENVSRADVHIGDERNACNPSVKPLWVLDCISQQQLLPFEDYVVVGDDRAKRERSPEF